jgi:molybdenum cofactor biosynthesis enzyme MoaA
MSDIRHIIFGGGEPLLIKDHLRFITKLVESGHSAHIELRYHTNGTQLTEQFIELWSQFKHVELMISLDDWGSRNDYVRYPAKWDTISAHLDRLDETGDNITVNLLATVHAMNVYNLPDYAMAVINRGWKKICVPNDGLFSVGTTHWPQYMSTTVLPKRIKDVITFRWNSYAQLNDHPRWKNRIYQQIDYMNSRDDSHLFPALLDYIEKLDTLRPIKFSDLYQDYYRLLTND